MGAPFGSGTVESLCGFEPIDRPRELPGAGIVRRKCHQYSAQLNDCVRDHGFTSWIKMVHGFPRKRSPLYYVRLLHSVACLRLLRARALADKRAQQPAVPMGALVS
jgi:hypothetical protein